MPEYVKHLRRLVGGDELLLLPSVSVALRDEHGRVLLARHAEGNVWLLPGGGIEPGETPADAAVREMWEETGLCVRLTRLVGIFGGPDHVIRYRNGDCAAYVSATFEAALGHGTARADGQELLEMRFVAEAEVNALPTAKWIPEVLRAVFAGAPAFRAPTWAPPGDAGAGDEARRDAAAVPHTDEVIQS